MIKTAITPLKGIRVVELSHMVMGPSTGLLMADLGAEVIKIEPIDGDKTRNLRGSGAGYFSMYNRNKKSISLDLKSDEGLEIAKKIISGSDVLIENFRSGTINRLGLDYETLSVTNPGLIYCSEKGFLSGPYEKRTALDEVAQMMGGLAYMTGPPGQPLRAGASVIDVMGGTFGVVAILAALLERVTTGKGKLIHSGLYETCVFLVGQHMAQYAVTGAAAKPMPVRISAWSVYDIFETADNEKVFVGIVTDSQWRAFCEKFELSDWAQDSNLATNNQRIEKRTEILERLGSLFKTMTTKQLIDNLSSFGAPFAPIKRPEDLFEDPHLNANGGLTSLNLPDGTKTKLPSLPIEINGQRPTLKSDPPQIGQHSIKILNDLGFEDDEIQNLINKKVIGNAPDK